jgi:hypothetical protein
MRPIASTARSRALGLWLTLVCGLAIAAPADAQWWGQQGQVGNTVAVPGYAIRDIWVYNVLKQRNVNVLKVTQGTVGNWNTQVIILGVNQRNRFGGSSPSNYIAMPRSVIPVARQLNINKTFVEQTSIGNGNTQVVDVQVSQENSAAPATGRYFLCPTRSLDALFQLNFNLTIITQIAIGNGNTQVALVGVTQGNQVKVPKAHANGLVQINSNVSVVTQVAVGDGNEQVTVLNVYQNNG